MNSIQFIRPVLRLSFRSKASFLSSQASRNISTSTPDQRDPPRPSTDLGRLAGDLASKTFRSTRNELHKVQPDAPHRMQRQPWHLHCYATKHNTHLTLTKPNRDVVVSISAGQIGFKKSQRGSYDAAYQLGAYFMARIQRLTVLGQIDEVEYVMRGFGQGREAFSKILTGSEGSVIRHKVSHVTDATRVKIGGTRSPRPRRLG